MTRDHLRRHDPTGLLGLCDFDEPPVRLDAWPARDEDGWPIALLFLLIGAGSAFLL